MESVNADLEELTICSSCKRTFNETDHIPKLLVCKHYFCLECIRTTLAKGQPELYCIHCWKRTEFAAETVQKSQDLSDCLPTHKAILALTMNLSSLRVSDHPNDDGAKTTATATASVTAKRDICAENCVLHSIPLSAWCTTCCLSLCCACLTMSSEHQTHQVKAVEEVRDQFLTDIQIELVTISKLLNELQRMQVQHREFQLKVLEACTMLKTSLETELSLSSNTVQTNLELLDLVKDRYHAKLNNVFAETNNNNNQITHEDNVTDLYNVFMALNTEKTKIKCRLQELFVQNQYDEVIPRFNSINDLTSIKQTFTGLLNRYTIPPTNGHSPQMPINSTLSNHQVPMIQTLTNYCLSQLFLKNQQYQRQTHPHLHSHSHAHHMQHFVAQQSKVISNKPIPMTTHYVDATTALQTKSPTFLPTYYFNIEVNSTPFGRIVIEVRTDTAPKMAKNFDMLVSGELGYGYKNCSIFQCWENESIITGDYEMNNGRGGKSPITEDGYFIPDDTKILASRGSVGMRRSQKKHDNCGSVASQFRIVVQEMRGFTAIFGHVVEGIELVDKISSFGDSTGKPSKSILISDCGKLSN